MVALHSHHAERSLAGAALFWLLFVWRWFDVGTPLRPALLEIVPPLLLAAPALLMLLHWLGSRGGILVEPRPAGRRLFWLLAAVALVFRLPLVVQGAAGAVTPDGALSGIVLLRVLSGAEHLVFVPNVPYSGSLKSHLGAGLALFMDPARAFALVSVLFYVVYVAGVARLAQKGTKGSRVTALAAGLYAAFAPPFVTRYSVSNDGNYVEVLALSTWALVLAVRWVEAVRGSARPHPFEDGRGPGFEGPIVAVAVGLLLGLAFWCHILAVIPLAAVVATFLLLDGRAAVRSLPAFAGGWVLGNAPGLFWNLAHRGESFLYFLPGGPKVGGQEAGPGLLARLRGLATDQLPVLFGYDLGYGPVADLALRLLGWAGLLLVMVAVVRATRAVSREREPALVIVLVFAAVNVTVALWALPYIPGNARYVLLLTAPAAVLLAWAFAGERRGRVALALLIAGGATASLAQLPGTARADARWRSFVADLEAARVRFCYTDFYLATKINFLSGERIVCSAKLGPTTTEYFFDYRRRVEAAPEAALVAVNPSAARKLEERLSALGVAYVRRDLMKPVLLPSRKADPEELFPEREFPLR